MNQPYPAPPPPKKGTSALTIILVVLGVGAFLCLILGVLAISGVRKYIANAKTAEARNTLGHVAKLAVEAHERSADLTERRRLCASASRPVPADPAMIRGVKYQSAPADWSVDQAAKAGFACLKFEMGPPQYFQYAYEATASSFVVRARGDLDGDGVLSTFELAGGVANDSVRVAPAIAETDPEE